MNQVTVTLPDGSLKTVAGGMSVGDFIATQIGAGLAKAAIAAKFDGELVDLSRTIDRDLSLEVVTQKSREPLMSATKAASPNALSSCEGITSPSAVTTTPLAHSGTSVMATGQSLRSPSTVTR